MRFGMGLLLWSDDVTDEAWMPLFERLAAIGYDFVEVPVFRAEPARYERLAARLGGVGLEATAVTALAPEQDLLSEDAAARQAGADHLRAAVDCARALGSPLLGGPLYQALGRFSGAAPTGAERDRAAEALHGVAGHAQAAGLRLAIEPLNRFEVHLINTGAAAADLLERIAHPAAGLLWDTFHAHVEEQDPAAAIEGLGDRLIHVQASENDRGTPGRGQVAWAATFAALRRAGYAGDVAVEAFGQGLPALAAATRVWRRFFADEETLAAEALPFLRRAWDSTA